MGDNETESIKPASIRDSLLPKSERNDKSAAEDKSFDPKKSANKQDATKPDVKGTLQNIKDKAGRKDDPIQNI